MDEITVVALGPDRANQMTLEAAEALARAPRLILRTGRHGCASATQRFFRFSQRFACAP